MAQKTTTATAVEEKKKEGFWSTKITGVSLPLYLIMVLVLIIAMALGKLPTNMIGPIAVLVIFGNLFHFIGTKIPIVKSYLGGGSVFAIFASANHPSKRAAGNRVSHRSRFFRNTYARANPRTISRTFEPK